MPGPLTPKMQESLGFIRENPGGLIKQVPGGTLTFNALMRRGLVETDWHGTLAYPPSHEHEFKSTMHLDGCHFYENRYQCECGAQAQTLGERSPRQDPYSMIWMDPEGREPCARCEDLIGGARPRFQVAIVRPRQAVAA